MILWIWEIPVLPRPSKRLYTLRQVPSSESNCFEDDCYLHQIGPFMETFARVHPEPPLLLIEEVGRLPMIISNIILHSLLIPPASLFYGRKEIAFAI